MHVRSLTCYITCWVDVTLGFVLATECGLEPLQWWDVISIRSQLNPHLATAVVIDRAPDQSRPQKSGLASGWLGQDSQLWALRLQKTIFSVFRPIERRSGSSFRPFALGIQQLDNKNMILAAFEMMTSSLIDKYCYPSCVPLFNFISSRACLALEIFSFPWTTQRTDKLDKPTLLELRQPTYNVKCSEM